MEMKEKRIMDFSALRKKYQQSFIYVSERKKTIDSLNQLVDMEEKLIDFLPEKRLGLLAENTVNSIYFNGSREVSLKLFFVLNNEKSRKYYEHPYFTNTETDPLLEDDRLYIFLDETAGIIETNSSLLASDVRILAGISPESVKKQDRYFRDYVSAFEHKNELDMQESF
jgi:hypothetical protein